MKDPISRLSTIMFVHAGVLCGAVGAVHAQVAGLGLSLGDGAGHFGVGCGDWGLCFAGTSRFRGRWVGVAAVLGIGDGWAVWGAGGW